MGFFNRKKKDKTSMKDLNKLHGKKLSHVVKRSGGEEFVLGKNGGISILEDEIVIVCNATQVFRCKVKGAIAAELMSNNGVDIKGEDLLTGKKQHVIAYYANLR